MTDSDWLDGFLIRWRLAAEYLTELPDRRLPAEALRTVVMQDIPKLLLMLAGNDESGVSRDLRFTPPPRVECQIAEP
jgi:hypothetical protein